MLPRALAGSFVLLLLVLVAAGPGATDAGEATLQGDVNCGGSVDSIDSLQILRGTAGLSTNAPCLAEAGDVDCDDDADSTDSLRILRYVASLSVAPVEGCTPIGEPLGSDLPPTSEELIAEALDAKDISYDDSLLYRAYALFADSRLPDEYASAVIDWDAGTDLFGEIDDHVAEIDPAVLKQLHEFRARPNDPASIHFNTPPEGRVSAQGLEWRTALGPGTAARVWALGPEGAEQTYVPLVSTVWSHFLSVFAYPNPDQAGDPDVTANPDDAIDFYFVNPGIDPRTPACNVPNPNPRTCLAASDFGMAVRALPFVSNTSSGYLIVNAGQIAGDPLADDNLVDTIAHELAHISQYAYDKSESSWLYESTATWVAYRVMLDMGRTPDYAYDMAERLYEVLEKALTDLTGNNPKYRSWLFFQHAAMIAGDDVVSDVWENAKPPGMDGIDAVDAAFPLDTNWDDFTVRNWNKKPPIPIRYKDAPDPTFPDSLKVDPDELDVNLQVPGEGDYTLDLPVEPLSARYYRYEFGSGVRHVIFENNLVETDHAHVWLLQKIAGDWKPPLDMAGSPVQTWCRDVSMPVSEDLQELIVIVSYSTTDGPALEHPDPRVIADKIACEDVSGTASASLRVVDGLQDLTYTTNIVNLRFKPRKIQDVPGNIYYDLDMRSQGVRWVVSGTYGGCPAEGESTVLFPGGEYTGIEPAAGYLVVVGPGDNHSAIVTAYNPGATFTVTCPGDPPTISHHGFHATYLLHILGWPNSDNGQQYSGDCALYLGSTATYRFTWNLRAPDVVEPLRQSVEQLGPVPECFDATPCPPICSRDTSQAIAKAHFSRNSIKLRIQNIDSISTSDTNSR